MRLFSYGFLALLTEVGLDFDMIAPAGTRAYPVDRLVAHDTREPAAQAAGTRVCCERIERAHVAFLQHVFRFAGVAHDGHRHAIQPLVVATHDPREGVLIALR